jgi:hypothetical protein
LVCRIRTESWQCPPTVLTGFNQPHQINHDSPVLLMARKKSAAAIVASRKRSAENGFHNAATLIGDVARVLSHPNRGDYAEQVAALTKQFEDKLGLK